MKKTIIPFLLLGSLCLPPAKGANSTAISPDGKYALIQRTEFGELHDSQKVTSTEKIIAI